MLMHTSHLAISKADTENIEAVFIEKRGENGILCSSGLHTVSHKVISRLWSPAFHPNYEGKKSGDGKVFSCGWPHYYMCANFHNTCFFMSTGKGRVRGRGREVVGADFMSLNRHFMENGQPHFIADFNSRKRTTNLGSVCESEPHMRESQIRKGCVSSH